MKFVRFSPILRFLSFLMLLCLCQACSSTKSAVGGGLLTDLTGEFSRRDTIDIPLTGATPATFTSFPIQVSYSWSEILLAGEANGLRAVTLLKFSPLVAWQEEQYYTLNDKAVIDTLTFTPAAIIADSVSQLRLTYYGRVADSAFSAVRLRRITGTWNEGDSVLASLPSMLPPLAADLRVDTSASGSVVYLPIPTSSLTTIIADTTSFGVETASGSAMVRFLSQDGVTTYSPQLTLWIRANVTSKRAGVAPRDTLIGLTLRPAQDCYRLQRLIPAPFPAAGTLRLAGGAAWRAYVRLDSFPVDTPIVLSRSTVNSARLQVLLGPDGGDAFHRDSAIVQIFPVTQDFELDSARTGRLTVGTGRLYGVGFNTNESRRDAPDVREFEIADLVNEWWHQPTSNKGLLIMLASEDRQVNAVAIRGMKLIVTTTKPPNLVGKPASGGASR
jgi:hypothetical protein